MPQRLCALQVLRAVAAALVIFGHAQDTYLAKVADAWLPLSSFGLGGLGVKLFFCISGFMIYGAGMRMATGPASVAEFAWRRVIRVVPLYWAATLVYAAKLAVQGQAPTPGEMAGSLFFIAYHESLIRPVLGLGWTLNFEMFFYAIFATSLMLHQKMRAWWVSACFAMLFFLRWLGVTTPFGFPLASYLFLLTNMCLVYFLAGMALGWLRPKCRHWIQNAGLSPAVALGLATGLLGGYLLLAGRAPGQAAGDEMLLAALVVLVVGACLLEKPGTGAAAGRVFRALQAAGDASYSSYLTHGFVMGPAARLLALGGLPVPVWWFATAMVLACTVVGVLVHHVFEKPMLKRFSTPPWAAAPSRASGPGFQAPSRSSHSGR